MNSPLDPESRLQSHSGRGEPTLAVPVPEAGKCVIRTKNGSIQCVAGDVSEISVEANPEDWDGEYAEAVRTIGFNRVSLGVQSFDAEVLRALGRNHTPSQAISAIRRSQAVGYESVSLDLIYGTPQIMDRVKDVWVDRDYRKKKDGLTASDHAPVMVTMDV